MHDISIGNLTEIFSLDDQSLMTSSVDFPAISEITTSRQWCVYFRHNAANQPAIPWELGADAPAEQLAEIVPSQGVAVLQRGSSRRNSVVR